MSNEEPLEEPEAILVIADTKKDIPKLLHEPIVAVSLTAIESHGCFTIALSGGSLPQFLSGISKTFEDLSIDPRFDKWHVCLADERCVPVTHDDSNIKNIQEHFLKDVGIPEEQIYPIDESLLVEGSAAVASAYEKNVITKLLSMSEGKLDCAVLGFGPDGHTCSLFPFHELLKEETKLVASIDDSPKPPPSRITLTYPVLNSACCVVFCGAGASKNKILAGSFETITPCSDESGTYNVVMKEPNDKYPCAAVRTTGSPIIWVIDSDAADGLTFENGDE